MNVAAGPFYIHTTMPPLRMTSPPGYGADSPAPLPALPAAPPLRGATSQWIRERTERLIQHLHPTPPEVKTSVDGSPCVGSSTTSASDSAATPAVAAADILGAASNPRAFASTVRTLFHRDADHRDDVDTGTALDADPLATSQLIATLTARLAGPSAAPNGARFAKALQGARALAVATDGDAALALNALDQLPHISGSILLDRPQRGPATPTVSGAPQDASSAAWRAACLLSATRSGFDALLTLSDDHNLRAPGEVGEMKREALHTFLQAAAYLADHADPSTVPAPGQPSGSTRRRLNTASNAAAQLHDAISRLARSSRSAPDPQALALNALVCAARLMEAPLATAQEIANTDHVAAYVAWRSGYHERGPGTALARTQARMAKFLTWIPRAERRAATPATALDPRRWIGQQKSPLTATAFTAGGANLGLAVREAEQLQQAVSAALSAVSDRLGALAAWKVAPAHRRTEALLRQQAVAHWAAVSQGLGHPGECHPGKADRAAIVSAAAALAPGLGLDPAALASHRQARELKHLDLKALERWLQETPSLGVPAEGAASPAAASPATSSPAALIAQVREHLRLRPIRPAGGTRADIQDALTQVIDTTPLGNNVRYFDGGTYGVNANTSLNMQDFKAMIGLSLGPGYKSLRGRHAFLEIGSSSYGGEVFMGVDKRTSHGGAVGLFGGIALGIHESIFHVSLGGGAGYAYSHDTSAPSGVIIRTRVRRDANNKPTDSWRGLANDVLRFLFEQSVPTPAPAGRSGPLGTGARMAPEALWQAFSERFFRERDISVNWRDQRRSSHTVSEVRNAMARFSLAGWHFGPSFAASNDHLVGGKNERIDANGWLKGLERSRARSSALNVNLSLVSASASPGHFARHPGQPESVSLPSVPMVGVSASLMPQGASVTLRMVDEHGDLHPGYIRCLVEFLDPASFMSYLGQRTAGLANTGRSRQRLEAFRQEVMAAATRGNQSFGESLKLRPEIVEVMNVHRDEVEMIRRCAAPGQPSLDPRIAALEGEIARLLNDPGSWKLSGYYTYEINTEGYTAGPAFIGQATAVTAANGERVLAELAMAELEALDQTAAEDVAGVAVDPSPPPQNATDQTRRGPWTAARAN
jgi:hypothetical protein